MDQIIFYLDESGNSASSFFTVGGFWIFRSSSEQNLNKSHKQIIKIRENVKKLEKRIKIKKNLPKKAELKWVNISEEEKSDIFKGLLSFGQHNISMTADLTDWRKNNGSIDCTYMYNYLVYLMLERLFKLNDYFSLLRKDNDFIKIILNCDQRPTAPDGKKSLKDYLTWRFNEFFQSKNLKNPFIFEVTYNNSVVEPLIRYADYYVGLINSIFKFYSGSKNQWDANSVANFKMIHQNLGCYQCFLFKETNEKTAEVLKICRNYLIAT